MPPSDKQIIDNLILSVEESNALLRSIRTHSRFETVYSFLKYALIVGALVLSYIQLSPYSSQIRDMFSQTLLLLDTLKTPQEKALEMPQVTPLSELKKEVPPRERAVPTIIDDI